MSQEMADLPDLFRGLPFRTILIVVGVLISRFVLPLAASFAASFKL
jgi:hypothetical protein